MITRYDGNLLLTPCPTVLVTSKNERVENVFTVSWAGIVSSHPEHVCIAINQKRLSYSIIKESKKFCINIPNEDLLDTVDYCGNHSGKDIDKFSKCNLNREYIDDYILLKECPMHILCDVVQIVDLGSHHLFIAKVLQKYIDDTVAKAIHEKLHPIAYYRPFYYKLESLNAYHGYTVDKHHPKEEY